MQKKQVWLAAGLFVVLMILAIPAGAAISISGLAPAGETPPESFTVSAIPEAPTIIASALLVLPFGLCALKSLRKPRN